jgi:hypothetical protein
MHLELSTVDRQIIASALRLYGINRAAAGKLESQKIRRADRAESDRVQRRYDTLAGHIQTFSKRLENVS